MNATSGRAALALGRWVLFSLVLIIAGYLRIAGITWSLSSGFGHYKNFQPDEFVSMRGMLQVKPLAGSFEAPGAYFEGTFNYYLWALPQETRELFGKAKPIIGEVLTKEDFEFVLMSGRLMTVLFDLATLLVLFLFIAEVTGNVFCALLGAFLYGIVPMQVVYAHFMRTHILSNLFCALVIWLSLRALKRRRWWMFASIGLLSGLGAATRYPVGVIISIPCLFLVFERRPLSLSWKNKVRDSIVQLLGGPIWWLGIGFIVGLFVGEPILFLNPGVVLHAITHETMRYMSANEFNPSQLLNLTSIWKYASVLIPFAAYPVLWILPYAAIVYLCFRRRFYPIAIPLLLFSGIYTYSMAKGYLFDFARPVMLLLPTFFILVSLAVFDLWTRSRKQKVVAVCAGMALAVLTVPSLLFDWAYVHAMKRRDVRVILRNELANLIGDSTAVICVFRNGGYFYTAMPAVEPLRSQKVTVKLQDITAPADFFVVGYERAQSPSQLALAIMSLESMGKLELVKSYSVEPKIFGRPIDLSEFPSDMTYPFPTLLLFRAASKR